MERTIVGWNFPNLITIPTMALGGFLLFALAWQLIKHTLEGQAAASTSAAGF